LPILGKGDKALKLLFFKPLKTAQSKVQKSNQL
jgi:hypothetical protein